MRSTPLYCFIVVTGVTVMACTQQSSDSTETTAETAPAATADKDTKDDGAVALPRTPSIEGAKVFFKGPADGASVKSPVKLDFGLEGMTVVKAGDNTPGTGHHHLIVDADLPPMGAPIPSNENYIHFGDGSTSTELELAPGEHKLQLLLGDYAHIPHDPPVYSDVLTINVTE
ncbi:MAG: DUF4399 domain-containing protein [Myxococcota bacterium]